MFKLNEKMMALVRLQRTWAMKAKNPRIADLYLKSCEQDLKSMVKALPKKEPGEDIRILDIGAGLGGVDVLLYHHYKSLGVNALLYALDKNEVVDNIKYGYSNKPSFYNDLQTTKEFWGLNGVPFGNCCFSTEFPKNKKFDLIISLISCGFHYPILEYISYIRESITSKTMIVLDIRKLSGQFDTLHNTFDWVNCLQINKKYKRMACRGIADGPDIKGTDFLG